MFAEYLTHTPDGEIFIKGTRVDLATLVRGFLAGRKPEELSVDYPSVSLEQTYAAIAYYLGHRDHVDHYCSRQLATSVTLREEYEKVPA